MEMRFDQLDDDGPRDTASHCPQPTDEIRGKVVNLSLPECEVSLGIGLNMRLTMRYVASQLYNAQGPAGVR
jgi:hypothetical protein